MERLSSSSDDEEMAEEELTGLEVKLNRQAKFMKQRVGMEEDEDEAEEKEEAEKQRAVWGRGKKVYYGADNVNRELESSDEELAAEEEEVARQAQQEQAALLLDEDFEFADSEKEEETFEEAARKEKRKKDKMLTDGTIELKKDITSLSKAEQMEVLMSDAPELVGLQTDLRDSINELRSKVQPLLEKMKGGKGATEEGLRYLELKHMLLLSYCQAIVFYFLLKAEMPHAVRDHPVVRRLVELKLSLERLRPIEEKLQKQIDQLLTSNMMAGADEEESKTKANSQALKRAAKSAGNSKKRKVNIEETANGTNGHLEVEEENVLPIESQLMMNERKRLDARAQEDDVAHVPSSNAERKKAKRHKSSTGLTRMADDLEDDVEREDSSSLKLFNGLFDVKPRTLSQVIAEAGKPFKKPQIISGDADLPAKEDIGDRRRKHEIQKTNKELANMDDSDEEAVVNEPEEDDFYKHAVLLKEAKQAAKQAKYSRTLLTPVEEEDAEGKRSITWQMEKNRGLTPHRKKINKNPRKKYKLKHEKAVIRRKGQVREIRQSTTNYGGEASGIRTNISRSVRFKN